MKRREILKSLTLLPLAGAIGSTIPENAQAQQKNGWEPKKIAIPASTNSKSVLSGCIRSGNLLFISGIGGWYPDKRKEAGDVKVQTISALTAMKAKLEEAGSSMANVLKVSIVLADARNNFEGLNEVYGQFFPDPKPVRSYVGTSLADMRMEGLLLQIDCIAYVD
jgi:2-iminobutanoate/2-iminopropanoate deaminase